MNYHIQVFNVREKGIKYSKSLLFADDLKIYINAVVNWCEFNKLQLNIKKFLAFHSSEHPLLSFSTTSSNL